MTDLNKAILRINKKFGKNTIGKIGEMPTIKTECIPSGSPYLDNCIGGGWPLGKPLNYTALILVLIEILLFLMSLLM